MKNFEFYVPADILFGTGQEDALPSKLAAYGKKILLTYGGGSIKKNGLYHRLVSLLKMMVRNWMEGLGLELECM